MNIVQFWYNERIPEEIQELVSSWKSHNPAASHQLFNAESAAEFIQANFSSEICNAFCAITLPAMCSDVFRVAYVLKKGGVYIDCGTSCTLPIDQWQINPSELTLMRKWHGGVWNGLISAPANNPWLQLIWQKIERVLLERQEGDIYRLTGPFLFHGITENESRLSNEELDGLLPNTTSESRKITVKDQAEFSPLFSPHNALKHKSRSHWSKLQELVPLFSQYEQYRMASTAAIPLIDKHLVIHLVHSHAGTASLHEHHSAFCTRTSSTVIDFPLSRIGERPDYDCIINIARRSTAGAVSVIVDLTSCLSELDYHKPAASTWLYQLAELCNYFQSSQVWFGAVEQVDAIAVAVSRAHSTNRIPNHTPLHTPFHKLHLQSESGLHYSSRADVIERLLTCPALDYNLLDEALGFFFRRATITPLWSNKVIENHTGGMPSRVTLSAQEIEKIQSAFSESNKQFFQKYPQVESEATAAPFVPHITGAGFR